MSSSTGNSAPPPPSPASGVHSAEALPFESVSATWYQNPLAQRPSPETAFVSPQAPLFGSAAATRKSIPFGAGFPGSLPVTQSFAKPSRIVEEANRSYESSPLCVTLVLICYAVTVFVPR